MAACQCQPALWPPLLPLLSIDTHSKYNNTNTNTNITQIQIQIKFKYKYK